LQEDKERLFDSADTVHATVRIMAAMLRHTTLNESVCEPAGRDPALLATDLADYLVRKGMPFREAHQRVGTVVALAERQRKALNELSLEEFQSVDARFAADVHDAFDPHKALAERQAVGTPSPREVQKQLTRWRNTLAKHQSSTSHGHDTKD
jgi:argininosuccinate lyase